MKSSCEKVRSFTSETKEKTSSALLCATGASGLIMKFIISHHSQAIEEFVEFDDTIEAVSKLIDLDETLVVVTADHSHSMSFIGYDGRNTSVFDNVALTHNHKYGPSFVSPFGTFTKVMNVQLC